ncbi:hypothetical protein Tco_1581241, partial [Tanacetum coccineum]
VPLPNDSVAGRPALRLLILGGIIYTRENICNVSSVPADYVPAGHVLISVDRYRIC